MQFFRLIPLRLGIHSCFSVNELEISLSNYISFARFHVTRSHDIKHNEHAAYASH